jgi:hypothetical protein
MQKMILELAVDEKYDRACVKALERMSVRMSISGDFVLCQV